MADFKIAITMLAVLPSNRSQHRTRKKQFSSVEFSETLRSLVSPNYGHLPLQDVPRQAWLSIDRLSLTTDSNVMSEPLNDRTRSPAAYRIAMCNTCVCTTAKTASIAIDQLSKPGPCKNTVHSTVRAIAS